LCNLIFRVVFKFQDVKRSTSRIKSSLVACVESELATIVKAGTWKNERIIVSPQQKEITLSNRKKALNFCANNYLGLAVRRKQSMLTLANVQYEILLNGI